MTFRFCQRCSVVTYALLRLHWPTYINFVSDVGDDLWDRLAFLLLHVELMKYRDSCGRIAYAKVLGLCCLFYIIE